MSEDIRAKYFLPPDDYEILRFGGESVKDEEKGIERMMRYYQEFGLTEEQLRENSQKYNLNQMFQIVKDYFEKEYGYHGKGIELSNRYQHSVNSYIFFDEGREQFVHIDELFESSVMSFFLVVLKWSKEFDDLEIYGNCFLYLLFIMNDVSILGDIPNEKSNEALLQIMQGDAQIMNLASSCYWTVVIFSLAHEVAHSYFATKAGHRQCGYEVCHQGKRVPVLSGHLQCTEERKRKRTSGGCFRQWRNAFNRGVNPMHGENRQ